MLLRLPRCEKYETSFFQASYQNISSNTVCTQKNIHLTKKKKSSKKMPYTQSITDLSHKSKQVIKVN